MTVDEREFQMPDSLTHFIQKMEILLFETTKTTPIVFFLNILLRQESEMSRFPQKGLIFTEFAFLTESLVSKPQNQITVQQLLHLIGLKEEANSMGGIHLAYLQVFSLN